MKPSLASIGFMTAINKWNNWVTGEMYISKPENRPLQNVLMAIENNIQALMDSDMAYEMMNNIEDAIPADSARMALLFTVLGPIMFVYPFFQKYFVKGLTLGSVKG